MEQDIRLCEVDGHRLAYAIAGEGPTLVFGGRWVSDLELEWDEPGPRAFFEELAQTHRVVRYDRLGCGLSDRAVVPTPDTEPASLAAVLDALGGDPVDLFACSCAVVAACRFAAAQPERVRKLVFFGSWVSRSDIPESTGQSLVDFARTNWPLAAQMLAGLFAPNASGPEIAALSRHKRHAASAEVAAAYLEIGLRVDLRPLLSKVTAPALVLHRRGDRTVPVAHGRELASLLPNGRLVTLGGNAHLPWLDDNRETFRALNGFLDDAPPALAANGNSPLTRRETEVMRLVASGLSNRDIASSLVLSEHTVHRHVANILRKLAASTRAGAAAHATRAGLI
jgi:pimeloyl-ACP methyl ester carboxylesterase/DNA-binding CsgD family transcriptional regulator